MFTSSGVGVLAGGSLAQLDTLSTELNLRSDNGRCRLTVALEEIRILSSMLAGYEEVLLTHE